MAGDNMEDIDIGVKVGGYVFVAEKAQEANKNRAAAKRYEVVKIEKFYLFDIWYGMYLTLKNDKRTIGYYMESIHIDEEEWIYRTKEEAEKHLEKYYKKIIANIRRERTIENKKAEEKINKYKELISEIKK